MGRASEEELASLEDDSCAVASKHESAGGHSPLRVWAHLYLLDSDLSSKVDTGDVVHELVGGLSKLPVLDFRLVQSIGPVRLVTDNDMIISTALQAGAGQRVDRIGLADEIEIETFT